MTEEYAKLSLRAGFIAAAIEQHTGDPGIIRQLRQWAWKLTPEMLERLKRAAIDAGLTKEQVAAAEAEAAEIGSSEQFMRWAMDAQRAVDKMAGVKEEDDGTGNRKD